MRLQDKFKRVFILPLICGILLSIILTVTILILYAQNFSDDQLLGRLKKVEASKSDPLLQTASNILFKKFQKSIQALHIFKKYYSFYADNLINKRISVNQDLINKYLISSVDLAKNYQARIKGISTSSGNSTYLDHAFWHYNSTVSDIQQLKNDQIYNLFTAQLAVNVQMLPIMRAIYETSQDNISNRFDLIYFASKKSTLFSGYPVYANSEGFFHNFIDYTNDESCKDLLGVTPKYYYFPCRDWWQQIVGSYSEDYSSDIVITHPYKFAQTSNFGVTVCIRMNDPLSSYYYPESTEDASFCVDIDMTDVISTFDHFNKELSGYFYVLRVNSDIPLYYPLILQQGFFARLERFEFGIESQYYVNELTLFSENIIKCLIDRYDDYPSNLGFDICGYSINTSMVYPTGQYKKNATVHDYSLHPVKLYSEYTSPNTLKHMLTIVYVDRWSSLKTDLQQFQATLYPRLIIQIFLFSIMGAILVLIAWYLIISIALNIVRPIKNLKFLIQGMNKGVDSIQTKTGLPDNHGSNEFNYDQENEIDEDNIDIRSAEMDELFNILLKLKDVLSFTTNSKAVYDKSALINYVYSKYTFNEVSNMKGKMVCDSNVGNLALKCQKFDKAIFHLLEALQDIKKVNKSNANANRPLSDILATWRKSFQSSVANTRLNRVSQHFTRKHTSLNLGMSSSKDVIGNGNNLNNNNENNSDTNTNINTPMNDESKPFNNPRNCNMMSFKKETHKAIFLESRYPKLIYAYKKFFKFLRRLISLNKNDVIEEMILNDIYVLKERHSLENYENILTEYLTDCMTSGDTRRTGEAFLEYIEFLLIYKLKLRPQSEDNNINYGVKYLNFSQSVLRADVQQSKIEILDQICQYFKEFDHIYDILRRNSSSEYFKSFLDQLRNNRKENLEIVETPYLILLQKSNYLKGKLAKYCGHYQKALEYFDKSKEMLILCDARIIKKSIKQIKKIMIFLHDEIDKELHFESITNNIHITEEKNPIINKIISHGRQGEKYPSNTSNPHVEKVHRLKEQKQEIEKYIQVLEESVSRFSYFPKDLVILIDISDSMKSDPKKIERAVKTANNFFDLYITTEDRFSLFVYVSTTNPIIALTEKNYNSYSYIKSQIENLPSEIYKENMSEREDSKSGKALICAYQYLIKKSNGMSNREKWIILFTDKFNHDITDLDMLKSFKEKDTAMNIIIVGIDMSKDHSVSSKEFIAKVGGKSDFINFEDIARFKSIVKIHGSVKDEFSYPNERYESDKKI